MKKHYLKPEVEYVNFKIEELITAVEDDDYVIGSLGGEAGDEDW